MVEHRLQTRGAAITIQGQKADLTAIRLVPLDHAIHKSIGKLVTDAGLLEHLMDKTIWKLLGVNEKAGCSVTSSIQGPTRRVGAIINLCKAKGLSSKALIKELEKFKRAIVDVTEPRNRIVHDPWYLLDGDPERPCQYSTKKPHASGYEEKTLEYINEKIAALEQKIVDLGGLVNMIDEELSRIASAR
ncbi:MAG: hypothetical protein U1E42_10385 [Rhodospirillales bacterium]